MTPGENEWEMRFETRDLLTSQLRHALEIRVFGPWQDDCSHILNDAVERVETRDGFHPILCFDNPKVKSVEQLEGEVQKDVYDFYASMECIEQADVGVFIFMEARPERFDNGPNQDLNSSVVVELYRWIQQSAFDSRCLVIYEGSTTNEIGTLVKGLQKSNQIPKRELDPSSREEAVDQFSRAIAGQCSVWKTELESMLCRRIGLYERT